MSTSTSSISAARNKILVIAANDPSSFSCAKRMVRLLSAAIGCFAAKIR
jgi:hypothetical protein